eukprot:IDg1220t1
MTNRTTVYKVRGRSQNCDWNAPRRVVMRVSACVPARMRACLSACSVFAWTLFDKRGQYDHLARAHARALDALQTRYKLALGGGAPEEVAGAVSAHLTIVRARVPQQTRVTARRVTFQLALDDLGCAVVPRIALCVKEVCVDVNAAHRREATVGDLNVPLSSRRIFSGLETRLAIPRRVQKSTPSTSFWKYIRARTFLT